MYGEAGAAQLNTVHELWRHNSMQELQGEGIRGIYTVNPRKLEHGFRRIRARIPYNLP